MGLLAPAKITSIQDHKQMKEEKANYGFTMVSNEFLDEKLAKIKSFSELKVVLAIIRKTIGFQKQTDQISVSQLQKFTGLSKQGVFDGLELALKDGLIEREAKGQYFIYALKVVNDLDQLDIQSGQRFRPVVVNDLDQLSPKVVNDLDPQKKGLNKTINKRGGEGKDANASTPPKSRMIDLVETFPLNQEVLTQPKEPTTPPVSQLETQQTYPAKPAPKTSRKVRGDSRPGGGYVDVKLRDATLDHPAVVAYNEKFKLTPDQEKRDMIITQITDLGEWQLALDYWKDNGYRPLSVGKLLDCYRKGNYKNELPGNGYRNDRGPGRTATGNNGKTSTHGTASDPDYWNRPAEEIEREWAEFKL